MKLFSFNKHILFKTSDLCNVALQHKLNWKETKSQRSFLVDSMLFIMARHATIMHFPGPVDTKVFQRVMIDQVRPEKIDKISTRQIEIDLGLGPKLSQKLDPIPHRSHQLILVEILARDGVGCLFSSFLRPNSKRIHFSSKEAKNIFSITLV